MFGIKSWDLDQWFSSNFNKKWFLNIFEKSEKYQNGLLTQEDKNKLNVDIWNLGIYELLLQYDSKYLDKTWIIKNYNQQVILTSHLRENDKLYII